MNHQAAAPTVAAPTYPPIAKYLKMFELLIIFLTKSNNLQYLPEEKPSGNKRFISFTGRFAHNIQIRGVETKGSGWQTVSYQVDPQQLHRN